VVLGTDLIVPGTIKIDTENYIIAQVGMAIHERLPRRSDADGTYGWRHPWKLFLYRAD